VTDFWRLAALSGCSVLNISSLPLAVAALGFFLLGGLRWRMARRTLERARAAIKP